MSRSFNGSAPYVKMTPQVEINQLNFAWLKDDFVLPKDWKRGTQVAGEFSLIKWDGLTVLAGLEEHDMDDWVHISVSKASRLPTWDEMQEVKMLLIGDKYAIMVSPPKKFHVNYFKYCLHFFHRIAGHPLPEFSFELGKVRVI